MKKRDSKLERKILEQLIRSGDRIKITATKRRKEPKVDRVRPHRHRHGDLYCLYRCVETSVNPSEMPKPHKSPEDYIQPEEVCLYCRNPRFHECEKTLLVTPLRGVTWLLVLKKTTNCTNCFAGWQFEIIPRHA